MGHVKFSSNVVAPAACFGLALLLAGCRNSPDDATLTKNVEGQLASDSSITGQPVTATVQAGVVTLNGFVQNDAQKTIAARDAAGIAGVKEVQNNIFVGTSSSPSATASVTVPATRPVPVPASPTTKQMLPPPPPADPRHPAPIERPTPQEAYRPQSSYQPLPTPAQPAPPQEPPPTPPQPTYKQLTLDSGSTLPVRITQTLDSATTQQGTAFSGVIASDILINGMVAIPAGTNVSGTVDAVQEAAHYKGSALLTLSLSTVSRRGERIAITTEPYTVTGKGRGANTAEKVGGGAAVGAILGGIFGGGKGAAIGAAAGGGAGAGVNTVTRGQQVQIQSETVVRFHLANPMQVRVRTDGERNSGEGGFQQHPIQ